MRAVIINKPDGPAALSIADIIPPQPKSEDLLVKVHATALNRADLSQRRGTYPPPPGESDILGLEIAGDVVGWGDAVKNFKKGDRVFGLVGGGGYAEYCLLDQQMAMPIPENWTYEQAAAVPEVFLTAQTCLFQLGELMPGESVLIHAGGSGVGTAAIQMANHINALVYVTAGSDEKIQLAQRLGAIAGINYKTQNFEMVIKELTHDDGVDVIIDPIGGDNFRHNLNCLQYDGRLIQIAKMSGANCEIPLGLIIMKRLQIKGNAMRSRPLNQKREITQHFREHWLPLLEMGIINPVIDSVFPLEEVQAAQLHMENNLNFGKIVLRIEEN